MLIKLYLLSTLLERKLGQRKTLASKLKSQQSKSRLWRSLLPSVMTEDLRLIPCIQSQSRLRNSLPLLRSCQQDSKEEISSSSWITCRCIRPKSLKKFLRSSKSQIYSTFLTAQTSMESRAISHWWMDNTRSLCSSMWWKGCQRTQSPWLKKA